MKKQPKGCKNELPLGTVQGSERRVVLRISASFRAGMPGVVRFSPLPAEACVRAELHPKAQGDYDEKADDFHDCSNPRNETNHATTDR